MQNSHIRSNLGCWIIVVIVGFSLPIRGHASSPTTQLPSPSPWINFEHRTSAQGLLNGRVQAIVQDQLGFLWFGTWNGLFRYDGYTLKSYQHDAQTPGSLPENSIFSLLVDRRDILWLGTQTQGLWRFDSAAFNGLVRFDPHTAAIKIFDRSDGLLNQEYDFFTAHRKALLRNVSQLATWLVQDYTTVFDETGKEYADLLLQRVKRMNNLIDGVLEYSRVGRMNTETKPIDLNSLLPEVIDTLSPPPHITITLPDALPTAVGDEIQITQIFQNLIGNAIKYLDKPRGKIDINFADIGEMWQFRVTDNGPGIAPQHHDTIFQIFRTNQPRDEVESTGVGLTIVKKIIEFYGGAIRVESEVGQGSTFVFTLPKAPTVNTAESA